MAEEGARPKGASLPSREPYARPTIAWEEPLEDRPNLIAACAQRPLEDAACDANPNS
jgi:hypothetical protein